MAENGRGRYRLGMPTGTLESEHEPLRGIRVLDFSRVLAGPYGTMHLADLGADVVKVEPLAGEVLRQRGGGLGVPFSLSMLNTKKRGIAVDLKHPDGKELMLNLVREADVLLENFAPGAMARPRLSTGVPGYAVASPDSSTTAASLAAAADADPTDPATFAELSPNTKSRILSAVAMKNPTTRDMMARGAAIFATFAAPCTLASTTAPTGPPVVPMPR